MERDTLENAQRRAEYWKAESIAANSIINGLQKYIKEQQALSGRAVVSRQPNEEARIVEKLKQLGDDEEFIYSAELYLLRKIAEASRNVVRGRHDSEFCTACGGQDRLISAHQFAVENFERWMADSDDRLCG